MNKLPLILSLIVGAMFLFFGVSKFIENPNIIFTIIADNSGISLFEPGIRILTGVAELGAGLLILIPKTRQLGALAGLAIVAGAIGFHLSPWLGISIPGMGHGLFITAVVLFVLNLLLLAVLRKGTTS